MTNKTLMDDAYKDDTLSQHTKFSNHYLQQ